VIDGGINHLHPSFADVGGDGYDHDNPWTAGTYVGYCVANPTYCNDKLIGAWSFLTGIPSPEDTSGHGSHTASTAGGNRHFVDAYGVWIQGVAPHANLVTYRVCETSQCPGDIVGAINQAVADGVNVINYSISGSDNPWSDPVELAYLDAANAGIFVSASAGNSGPDDGTVAHTSPWLASVAASTHGRYFGNFVDVTGPTTPPELQDLYAVPGSGIVITTTVAAEVRYDAVNQDGCATFADPNFFDGAIALIVRGNCNFSLKATNAEAAGAIATLVYNNVPGAPIVMGWDPAPPANPAVMISDVDGLAIKGYIDSNDPVAVTITIGATEGFVVPEDEDIISDFSSRGFSDYENLAPSYAAPGVDILAAVAASAGDPLQYALYGGTSMAAPHSAGSAALMIALHPDWSPAQIRSAIASTADNVGIRATDGAVIYDATPREMGSGRVDLTLAALAGLVMDETYDNYVAANPAAGGTPRDLNQPSLVNYACAGTCFWTRTVENVLNIAATYTATFTSTIPMTVTIEPNVFTLNPGETQVLTITANVVGLPYDEYIYGDVLLETDAEVAGGVLINTVLLSETFSAEVFPPAGWSAFDLDLTGEEWITDTWDHTGDLGYSAFHDYSNAADQDGWLVTPPVAITADAVASVDFWEDGWFSSYYAGHYVYACDMANDCSNPPTNYVQLFETGSLSAWREVSVSLSAYAGSTVRVAFVYTGNDADEWWIDDVTINETLDTLPVSDQHLTVVVMPSAAALPDLVDIYTNWRHAMADVVDLASAEEITDLQVSVDGLIPGWASEKEIIQDPTNGNPYDNSTGTIVQLIDVPAGATLLLVEVVASDAPDVDLFVGTGSTPSAATMVCTSATGSWTEVCEIPAPATGPWWVVAQNWEASAVGASDLVKVVSGAFVPGDEGNMIVTGPQTVPAGQPFDVTLEWNESDMVDGEYWFGSFTLGTSARAPGDIGTVNVRLEYDAAAAVTKTAPATAEIGDTIQYTIVVSDLLGMGLSGMAWLTDTIPAGLTIVTDSITTTYGTAWYDDVDNAVYWAPVLVANTVAAPAVNYAIGPVNTDLTLSSTAGGLVAAPAAPRNPEAVLWDQPLSATNLNAYANQDFSDMPAYTNFGVDDFVASNNWVIESIFVPGNGWNGFTTLMNASALNWAIYADAAGLPAGYPGNGAPVWSLSLAPTDAQVTITNGSGGLPSNTLLTLDVPGNLPAGTYWLFFYPTMPFSGGGQFGNQASDTANGYIGKWINPGGGFGSGTTWANWGGNTTGYEDIAFRIEGYEVATPSSATITFDVVVEDYGLFENLAELWYEGEMFYSMAQTLVIPASTFVYHDLEDVVAVGEDVYLAGDMNGWDTLATLMTANVDSSVFTATVDLLPGSYNYKYVVGSGGWANGGGDLLNTDNRNVVVDGDEMVHDYRNVTVGWSALSPLAIDIFLGDSSGDITAEVYIAGVTAETPAGRGRSYVAELGYGTMEDMSDFVWIPLTYVGESGNNDLLTASFTPAATGVYTFVVRIDGNWGAENPNIAWYTIDAEGSVTVTEPPVPYLRIFLPTLLKVLP